MIVKLRSSKEKAHGERNQIGQKHIAHQLPGETEPQAIGDELHDEDSGFRQ